ncbi:MAG TPA: hypothetical protein VIT19_05945 [Pyrinomonadaceae bacterium]
MDLNTVREKGRLVRKLAILALMVGGLVFSARAAVGGFLETLTNFRFVSQPIAAQDKPGKVNVKDREDEFPIATFDAESPTGPEERNKRNSKGRRYNRRIGKVQEKPNVAVITDSENPAEKLLALPINESDAVVIGNILTTAAFMSEDKTGVYSEFKVSVEEVLKKKDSAALLANSNIVLERPGGRVKFPSGRVQLHTLEGQRMPLVGHRYLMFLRETGNDGEYVLLVAYDLSSGVVVPLDHFQRQRTHQGSKVDAFISQVRASISVNQSRD